VKQGPVRAINARRGAPQPSPAAMQILHAMANGPVYVYGLRVIELTGLPSGTVYPAMRRLERDGLVQSHWEQQSIADAEQRPLRKYYKLTPSGWQ
jgi:PadR family transcriptional regulator, regulatory protein PadR